MGRAARYTEQAVLDAALELVVEGGVAAATGVAIAQRLGAPSGSIYYRFSSHEKLMATLWIRTIRRFQQGFLEALAGPEPRAAAAGAIRHTLQWAADHPGEAQLLTQYRRADLLARWPEVLGDDLAGLNTEVQASVHRFTIAFFGEATPSALGRARFALIEIPYAAVRQRILADGPPRGTPLPRWLIDSVLAASSATLDFSPRS